MRQMLRHPVFPGILAVAVVTACVAAMVDPFGVFSLPDPASADRDGIFRWLATCDLAEEATKTRQAIRYRLEEELDLGIDASELSSASADQSQRISDNVELLLKEWFEDQATRYHETPNEFVLQLLARIEKWQVAKFAATLSRKKTDSRGEPSRQETTHSELLQLQERVKGWIEHAQPDKRTQMQTLADAITRQVFIRAFLRPRAKGI